MDFNSRKSAEADGRVTRQRPSIMAWMCIALVWVARCAAANPTQQTDVRPNFIVFFTDDQGYNDVACYGSPALETPCFDRMAREGTRLTSFYAQNVCGTSRAALLTGCYPIRCGEPANHKNPHTVLHPQEWTIAEVLREAGYTTACIGKWHVAGNGKLVLPRPANPVWTVWYGRMIEAIEKPQLYDMSRDLSEVNDVADGHPEVVARLMTRIGEIRATHGDYDQIGRTARFFDPGPHRPDMEVWKE